MPALIDLLKKPIGDLAEEVSKTPIPLDTLDAIKALYGVVGALLDPCTRPGKLQTRRRLIRGDTGRIYGELEALDKVDGMCEVLQNLKALAGGK